MSTTFLGRDLRLFNHLRGSDGIRADLAARILAADVAAGGLGALVVLCPRLYSTPLGDGCDLCGEVGPVCDEVQWDGPGFTHIWLVHRRCLASTIQRASEVADIVNVQFGLPQAAAAVASGLLGVAA